MPEVIVVVGGAGGIGSAIVEKYIEMLEGSEVEIVIGDIDNEAAQEVKKIDEDVISFYEVDTRDYESICRFKEKVAEEHGSIRHLISLAGFALEEEFSGLEETSAEAISESVDLNLKSHIYLSKEFKLLLERSQEFKKSIVLVSSINAIEDYGLPAYSSAKAGMIGLNNSAVGEFGQEDIRINTVLPGTVTNERSEEEPKDNEKLRLSSPLNRLSTPEEVAKAVYAVTHLMTSVTGEQIVADCGQTKVGTDYIQ